MLLPVLLLALTASGCSTTYVPISWGFGEQVRQISRSDQFLTALFNRFDPDKKTLRVSGESFNEVMMPSEVRSHVGAYRRDTRLIYRNYYQQYTEEQLRSLMLHELAHHVWYTGMNQKQHEQWLEHLRKRPSPLQSMVRRLYGPEADLDSEDFAFTVQNARPVDLEELARLNIITPLERDALLKSALAVQTAAAASPHGQALLHAAVADPATGPAQATPKGAGPAK